MRGRHYYSCFCIVTTITVIIIIIIIIATIIIYRCAVLRVVNPVIDWLCSNRNMITFLNLRGIYFGMTGVATAIHIIIITANTIVVKICILHLFVNVVRKIVALIQVCFVILTIITNAASSFLYIIVMKDLRHRLTPAVYIVWRWLLIFINLTYTRANFCIPYIITTTIASIEITVLARWMLHVIYIVDSLIAIIVNCTMAVYLQTIII